MEEGQRTIRRKASEKRKTQHIWSSMCMSYYMFNICFLTQFYFFLLQTPQTIKILLTKDNKVKIFFFLVINNKWVCRLKAVSKCQCEIIRNKDPMGPSSSRSAGRRESPQRRSWSIIGCKSPRSATKFKDRKRLTWRWSLTRGPGWRSQFLLSGLQHAKKN